MKEEYTQNLSRFVDPFVVNYFKFEKAKSRNEHQVLSALEINSYRYMN